MRPCSRRPGSTPGLLPQVTAFLAQASAAARPAPGFAVFLGGLCVAAGALVLWLELVVRAAAVAAAALFLPMVLAALVWPAVAHWCRRLADTLAALILSKLVVAAILSLAVGAVSEGLSGGSKNPKPQFGAVVLGVALLILATVAPFVLLRMIPAIEAGAVAHLEAARHHLRRTATAPAQAAKAIMLMPAGGQGAALAAGDAAGVGWRTPRNSARARPCRIRNRQRWRPRRASLTPPDTRPARPNGDPRRRAPGLGSGTPAPGSGKPAPGSGTAAPDSERPLRSTGAANA